MSSDMDDLERFKAASFEPLSFRERGTTVPFTTPLLVNARIREAMSGNGLEMVVPNPSGGRGALIVPWDSMPSICSPTLFDRHLWESLARTADISPIGIQLEAQRLAMQGLAGKHAAFAARDAERREQASQRLVRSMLLESLIKATDGSVQSVGRLVETDPEAFHKLARRALVTSAEIAGVPLGQFADELEVLVQILTGAMPEVHGGESKLRRLLMDLMRATDEIATWFHGLSAENIQFHAARFVEQSARQTIECSKFVLARSDALIANFGQLASNWKNDRDVILDRAMRPEMVLDGWRTPVTVWNSAEPNQRHAAIVEIALIAPILPREAKTWLGKGGEWYEVPRRIANVVREKADWRSGNSLELVTRTENLVNFSAFYSAKATRVELVQEKRRLSRPAPREKADLDRRDANSDAAAARSQEMHGSPLAEGQSGQRSRARTNRAITNQLEVASDEALAKIVAVVDGLGNPEMRSRILGPSLPRLKRLRPPRQVSLMRLLFLPISGALIETAQWEHKKEHIPRSAIKPLMDTLDPALEPRIGNYIKQLQGKTFDEAELVGDIGNQLWHIAAHAGLRLRASPFWKNTGLSPRDIDAIVSLALGLWRHGKEIWDGMQEAAGHGRPAVLRAALMGLVEEGKGVFSAALEAMLQSAPRPSVFAPLLLNMPDDISETFENMLMRHVGNTLARLPESDFAAGANLAADIGGLINALEDWHVTTRRLDPRELFAHRRSLAEYCLTAYREVISVHVAQALLDMDLDQSITPAEIEAMAKIACHFEETGKRFGTPQGYDVAKEEFQVQLDKAQHKHRPMAAFADEIIRIREILIGRDAADHFLLRTRL
jgi:hypothetical protein